MRKIIIGAVGAAVAVSGLMALAGPASAAPTTAPAAAGTTAEAAAPAYIIKPTTAYQWPTKNSPAVITGLTQGQQVTAHCFVESDVVEGNKYWFRISRTADPNGTTGFVPKDVISVGGGLPNCWPNGN